MDAPTRRRALSVGMANPHTAKGDASIFCRVDRADFERNVNRLSSESVIPGANIVGIAKPADNADFGVSVDLEESLANGFAFIASIQQGAHSIAAATVQMLSCPERLLVTLASNDGLPDHVLENMQGKSTAVALFILGVCCLQLGRPSNFRHF